MDLPGTNYRGGPISDPDILERLPDGLARLLRVANGLVAFRGAFHLRGAVLEPAWHSLRRAWMGSPSLHDLFPAVRPDDIPFGENSLGDQFVLRAGRVHKLYAEPGSLADLEVDLEAFLADSRLPGPEFLHVRALDTFLSRGGALAPGELLCAEPSVLVEDALEDVSFTAVPALPRIEELSRWARAMAALPDGTQIEFGPEN